MKTLIETANCALVQDDAGVFYVSASTDGLYRRVKIDEDYAYDLMDIADNQAYWLDVYVLSELQAAKTQKNGSYYERDL